MATLSYTSNFLNESFIDSSKRFIQVIPAALAITLILVLGMERLIATAPVDIIDLPIYRLPDPVAEIREPVPVEIKRVEKPTPPELAPELPNTHLVTENNIDFGPKDFRTHEPTIKPVFGGYSSDSPIATVLVQPEYPARALAKGIEGYVDVRFDVTPAGTTQNITVIGAEPQNIFDKAAIKAVKNWKFQPVVIQGEAKPYSGMEQRITFQMQS